MTWILLQLVFPLLLLIVPLVLYKSSNSYMTRFYIAMLRNKAARRLYLQTLLIVLLLFHYIYVSGHFGEFGVLFSTILCGILFSHKRAERWLHLMKAHRQLYFRMAVLSMAMVAIPHLYTMAVTVAFLLLAATFLSVCFHLVRMERQGKTGEMESRLSCTCRTLLLTHHSIVPEDVDNGTTNQSTALFNNTDKTT